VGGERGTGRDADPGGVLELRVGVAGGNSWNGVSTVGSDKMAEPSTAGASSMTATEVSPPGRIGSTQPETSSREPSDPSGAGGETGSTSALGGKAGAVGGPITGDNNL
jgi:hypothetical protein